MIVRHDFGARRQVTAASGHDDVLAAHAEALGGSFAEVEMRESRGLSPDPTRECVGHLVTLLAKRPDSYRSKSQRWDQYRQCDEVHDFDSTFRRYAVNKIAKKSDTTNVLASVWCDAVRGYNVYLEALGCYGRDLRTA
jgi:hypothetical protein